MGPAGDQGPAGPPGPAGTSSLEVVRFDVRPALPWGNDVITSLGHGLNLGVACPELEPGNNYPRAYLFKDREATEDMWVFGTSGLPAGVSHPLTTQGIVLLDLSYSLGKPTGVIVQGTSHLWRVDSALTVRDPSELTWCRVEGIATVEGIARSGTA